MIIVGRRYKWQLFIKVPYTKKTKRGTAIKGTHLYRFRSSHTTKYAARDAAQRWRNTKKGAKAVVRKAKHNGKTVYRVYAKVS